MATTPSSAPPLPPPMVTTSSTPPPSSAPPQDRREQAPRHKKQVVGSSPVVTSAGPIFETKATTSRDGNSARGRGYPWLSYRTDFSSSLVTHLGLPTGGVSS
ncbi:unnamed protein product [Urochloa humidicola]